MIGAAWGLGFVLGPALGGVLGGIDTRLPFWVAAGLTLLNAMYGLFVLPESLGAEHREKFSWKRANPLGSLKLLRSHHELFRLATVNGFFYLAHQVLPSVFVLYASFRYGWNEEMVGLTLAIVGVCGMVVQGGVVKRVVADFGERRTLLAGLLFGIGGFAIFGLAPVGIIFWLGIPVFSMMGLYGPSSQGLMTRHVQPSQQGQLQGANNSIMGVAGVIGPGIFTVTFAYCIGERSVLQLPGAPFLVALLMLTAAFLLAWKVKAE